MRPGISTNFYLQVYTRRLLAGMSFSNGGTATETYDALIPDLSEEEVVQRHLGLGIDVLQIPPEALTLNIKQNNEYVSNHQLCLFGTVYNSFVWVFSRDSGSEYQGWATQVAKYANHPSHRT